MKLSVLQLCERVGMSRQNYYKMRKKRQRKRVNEGLVKKLVQRERREQPRLGGLKLHGMLRAELSEGGAGLGRDRFFEVLRNHGLLLGPRPRRPRTTNSNHSLPVFRNELKGLELHEANLGWVSDITYIAVGAGYAYLSLITDTVSRKIIGYHLGESLESAETLQALEMALAQLPENRTVVHHSDRGCQYCSHEYVKRLQERGLRISMTEQDHCAENALAERVNGILKQEYYLDCHFETLAQARRAVHQAIELYNSRRPHRSLGMQTPDEVHRQVA